MTWNENWFITWSLIKSSADGRDKNWLKIECENHKVCNWELKYRVSHVNITFFNTLSDDRI